MRIIDQFHQKLDEIPLEDYPNQVLQIKEKIKGTSFFPGSDGLWQENNDRQDVTVAGVMIIGHNFDNNKGYQQSLRLVTEPITCPTWRNLKYVLEEAQIRLEECFLPISTLV